MKRIVKGDSVIVYYPDKIVNPQKAIVVAITKEPGKMIGVEFENPVGIHSCDGRGKDKYCMWITPAQIVTEEELKLIMNPPTPKKLERDDFVLEVSNSNEIKITD